MTISCSNHGHLRRLPINACVVLRAYCCIFAASLQVSAFEDSNSSSSGNRPLFAEFQESEESSNDGLFVVALVIIGVLGLLFGALVCYRFGILQLKRKDGLAIEATRSVDIAALDAHQAERIDENSIQKDEEADKDEEIYSDKEEPDVPLRTSICMPPFRKVSLTETANCVCSEAVVSPLYGSKDEAAEKIQQTFRSSLLTKKKGVEEAAKAWKSCTFKNFKVGDRVEVKKQTRLKGKTAVVVDPNFKNGMVQVSMDEDDKKGKIKSFKRADLEIDRKVEENRFAVGDKVEVTKETRLKGKTAVVVDPNFRIGMVQVNMDEEDKKGKLKSFKYSDLDFIDDARKVVAAEKAAEATYRLVEKPVHGFTQSSKNVQINVFAVETEAKMADKPVKDVRAGKNMGGKLKRYEGCGEAELPRSAKKGKDDSSEMPRSPRKKEKDLQATKSPRQKDSPRSWPWSKTRKDSPRQKDSPRRATEKSTDELEKQESCEAIRDGVAESTLEQIPRTASNTLYAPRWDADPVAGKKNTDPDATLLGNKSTDLDATRLGNKDVPF